MSALLSFLGLLLIFFAILMVIWLVMQVEYTVKLSWFRTTATITAMALLLGFGLNFLIVSSFL
jgi:uncharacterized metal-binding protein